MQAMAAQETVGIQKVTQVIVWPLGCTLGWVTHNESQKLKNGISYFYVVGYKITCDIIFFEKNIFLLPGIAIKISVM